MSRHPTNPISMKEPRPHWRHAYLVTFIIGTVFLAGLGTLIDCRFLPPLERFYLAAYVKSICWPALHLANENLDYLVLSDHNHTKLARLPDVGFDEKAPYLTADALRRGLRDLRRLHAERPVNTVNQFLSGNIFDHASLPELFHFGILGLSTILFSAFSGFHFDRRRREDLKDGILLRGPRFVDRHNFNTQLHSDGVGFATRERPTIRERLQTPRGPRTLAIPADAELEHQFVMGDTGVGKSTLVRQILRKIETRGEAAVIYDPGGEFAAEFYDEARGDVILNPFDVRMPYWKPLSELRTNAEALTLAGSIFVDDPNAPESHKFFHITARQIFAHLLQFDPEPEDLAHWLTDENEIDRRVAGTEMAQFIAKSAPNQRQGVLGPLATFGAALRLLSCPNDCKGAPWSALQWATNRRGWILSRTPSNLRCPSPLWLHNCPPTHGRTMMVMLQGSKHAASDIRYTHR